MQSAAPKARSGEIPPAMFSLDAGSACRRMPEANFYLQFLRGLNRLPQNSILKPITFLKYLKMILYEDRLVVTQYDCAARIKHYVEQLGNKVCNSRQNFMCSNGPLLQG